MGFSTKYIENSILLFFSHKQKKRFILEKANLRLDFARNNKTHKI